MKVPMRTRGNTKLNDVRGSSSWLSVISRDTVHQKGGYNRTNITIFKYVNRWPAAKHVESSPVHPFPGHDGGCAEFIKFVFWIATLRITLERSFSNFSALSNTSSLYICVNIFFLNIYIHICIFCIIIVRRTRRKCLVKCILSKLSRPLHRDLWYYYYWSRRYTHGASNRNA